MLETLFVLLALFLIIGSLAILLGRDPAVYATGFLAVMLSVAGLFGLLQQSFLFLAQVMVSVGAVVVLTLIVILTVNLKEEDLPKEPTRWPWIVAGSLVIAPFGWMLYRALAALSPGHFPKVEESFGTVKAMGAVLFRDWVLPFEILSLLLLAAMVGAIIIGKKEQRYDLES